VFLIGKVKRDMSKQVRFRIRVPAIVFNYSRHSRATDEGMMNGPSIFAYLVFRSRRDVRRRYSKAHEVNRLAQPRSETWRAMQDSKKET
jgi:hypothetical protein